MGNRVECHIWVASLASMAAGALPAVQEYTSAREVGLGRAQRGCQHGTEGMLFTYNQRMQALGVTEDALLLHLLLHDWCHTFQCDVKGTGAMVRHWYGLR